MAAVTGYSQAGRPAGTALAIVLGQALLGGIVGSFVLRPLLNQLTGFEIGGAAAAAALGVGSIAALASTLLMARADLRAGYSLLPWVMSFLVPLLLVRGLAWAPDAAGRSSDASRLVWLVLLGVVAAGAFAVLSGQARRRSDEDRLSRAGYEQATLEAERMLGRLPDALAGRRNVGAGFDGVVFGLRTSLKSTADRLDRVRPADEDLDDTHEHPSTASAAWRRTSATTPTLSWPARRP